MNKTISYNGIAVKFCIILLDAIPAADNLFHWKSESEYACKEAMEMAAVFYCLKYTT